MSRSLNLYSKRTSCSLLIRSPENDEEGFVDLKERVDEKIEEALKGVERSYSILVEPSDIEEVLKDKSFEMEDAELQDF